MSFLYRPTPVVTLGRGAYDSRNTLQGWPGATMRGVLVGYNYAPTLGKAKSARTGRSTPWITRSGTMGEFIPQGLGGLGDDSSDYYSGADASGIVPFVDPGLSVPIAPDLGAPAFSPTPTLFSSSPSPVSPLPNNFFGGLSAPPVIPAPNIVAVTPPAGAGPTGSGIPGTQVVGQATSAANGLLTAISSFFKPSTGKVIAPTYSPTGQVIPGYSTVQPYGGAGVASWYSWFTAPSGFIPQVPNWIVLVGSVVLFSTVFGAGRYRVVGRR